LVSSDVNQLENGGKTFFSLCVCTCSIAFPKCVPTQKDAPIIKGVPIKIEESKRPGDGFGFMDVDAPRIRMACRKEVTDIAVYLIEVGIPPSLWLYPFRIPIPQLERTESDMFLIGNHTYLFRLEVHRIV
jgi:hypothetical protein